MEEITFTESKRGKRILIYKKYIYNQDKKFKNGTTRYRCQDRSCKGSVILLEDKEVLKESETSHPANPDDSVKLITLTKIKKRAAKTSELNLDIIVSNTSKINNQSIIKFPAISSIKDSLTRM